jgi:hypothetical protein
MPVIDLPRTTAQSETKDSRTLHLVIRIENVDGSLEVHEIQNLNYEGFTFDDASRRYCFFATESLFVPGTTWTIKTLVKTTPVQMVNQLRSAPAQ